MSDELQQRLSSFKLPRTEGQHRRLATTSSGDSSNSPKSSLKVRDAGSSTRLGQSSLSERRVVDLSTSDDPQLLDTAMDILSRGNDPNANKSRKASIIHPDLTNTTSSPVPSPRTVSQPRGQTCYFDTQHGSSSPSSTPRLRPVMPRTRSSDIWHRSLHRSSGDHDSAGSQKSAKSEKAISEHSEPSMRIVPLKPPQRLQRHQTGPSHMIVVETPFEERKEHVEISKPASTPAKSSPIGQQSRRTSSIDARKLFSVPLQAFRRSIKAQDNLSSVEKSSHGVISRADTEHQGHKSLLKQDQTDSTLQKASVALENFRKTRKPKSKTYKVKSSSSTSSSDGLDAGFLASKGFTPSFNVVDNQSTEGPASTTSSILAVQMGSTPRNSPAETSTYKIKRSKSADTEEFFKIDISIRGHTSYLPSEARRIHTPPLPGDDSNTQTRGFFFDYRTPELYSPQSQHSSLIIPQDEKSIDRHGLRVPQKNPLVHRVVTKLATPFLSPHSSLLTGEKPQKSPSRAKTSEWYEPRLADIDRASSDLGSSSPPGDRPKSSFPAREYQSTIADMKKRELEAQLDYDIPEHLPSSPLCPRNPKYWRVIKQNSSQFRGCWMHGYGEYTVVPELTKAIPLHAAPIIQVTET